MSPRTLAMLLFLPACFTNLDAKPGLESDSGTPDDEGGDEDEDEDEDEDDGADDTAGEDDTGGEEEEIPPETCDNGTDDDLDGLADCDDRDDCADDGVCACVDDAAGDATGVLITSDNTSGTDDYRRDGEGCGSTSSSAPDHVVTWTSPDDACYAVHTFGSEFDTVLRLLDGCDGGEVDCSDDSRNLAGEGTTQSMLRVGGVAGQAHTFVVDGFSDSSVGAWTLTAEPVAALVDLTAGDDLGDATGTSVATGSNVESTLTVDASCTSGVESGSVQLRWTAPTSGPVTMDTIGSDFDTVLSVFGASGCVEMACNDDAPDGAGAEYERGSLVSFEAEAGTTYVVVLSGYLGTSGGYVLNIQ